MFLFFFWGGILCCRHRGMCMISSLNIWQRHHFDWCQANGFARNRYRRPYRSKHRTTFEVIPVWCCCLTERSAAVNSLELVEAMTCWWHFHCPLRSDCPPLSPVGWFVFPFGGDCRTTLAPLPSPYRGDRPTGLFLRWLVSDSPWMPSPKHREPMSRSMCVSFAFDRSFRVWSMDCSACCCRKCCWDKTN